MSLITKIPIQSGPRKRRIPNAFMLFVREQKKELVKTCPGENMTVIGTMLGKKWKSMAIEEKQVYYDKYNSLKEHFVGNSDLNSNKEEVPMEMEKDIIQEVEGLTKIDFEVDKADAKASKNQKKMNHSFEGTFLSDDPSGCKKYKTRLKSNASDSETQVSPKKKNRKPSRYKNPFLIFAKEQRGNIKATKNNHASTILGNMWQDLEVSEKQKYLEKAKQLSKEKISEGTLTTAVKTKGKKKNKMPFLKRTAKKENSKTSPRNAISNNPIKADNAASSEIAGTQAQLLPNTSHPQDSTSSRCQQSPYNCLQNPPCLNELNSASMAAHYAPYMGMGGFNRPPYYGYPGFYPHDPFPYPSPLWMYQQAMASYGCFPGASCHSYCHCGMSYRAGYPGCTSHFRSVMYGSTQGAYSGTSPAASATCTADNSTNSDGVAVNGNLYSDNSNALSDDSDRLVIVDDIQLESNDTTQRSKQE